MTNNEIKSILAVKLHDEGTYFTKKDILISRGRNQIEIVIKDYEHIPFYIQEVFDNDFGDGYELWIYAGECNRAIIYTSAKDAYDYKSALIQLGYYIGTRF